MMLDTYKGLVNEYINWLKQNIAVKEASDGWAEISTPFLDRHNDFLQIYAKIAADNILLSDDGYTIRDLSLSGFSFNTRKRKELLNVAVNGFGVKLDGESLVVKCRKSEFAQKKHDLIQAMLTINDMFFLSAPTVSTIFFEDVVGWMESKKVRYVSNLRLAGKSGFNHSFDFVIPKSEKSPERLFQTVNRPNKNSVEKIAFAWIDTKKIRSSTSRAFALLNDSSGGQTQEVATALREYEVEPLFWSQRESFAADLLQ